MDAGFIENNMGRRNNALDWEKSVMVSKFKEKGDIMESSNYCGIELKEHDLEKFMTIPRQVMFWCLSKRKVPEMLVRTVLRIYKRTKTKERTVGETETFEVSVGLHQGSALSLFLFVLIWDVLSGGIRNEELWELLYADDL
ncbi:uncharacterized protein [Palaemon carinicauda]|uniref:uncharacterized protein n=1 Tax=Palaemon carinicauda TaxID=392227 RepID=UPI0035B5D804